MLLLTCRLPSLTIVQLQIKGTHILPVAMLLGTMGQQLQQLRSLVLKVGQKWADAGASAWEQLCRVSQLTKLDLTFTHQTCSCLPSRLQLVGNLRRLRYLAVTDLCDRQQQQQFLQQQQQQANLQQEEFQPQQPQPQNLLQEEILFLQRAAAAAVPLPGPDRSFLSQLTTLSYLAVPVFTNLGLSAGLSACTNLQALGLMDIGVQVEINDQAWQAIGELTALTALTVNPMNTGSLSGSFHAALGNLHLLQAVTVGAWSWAALPVLATLPRLQRLSGPWQRDGAGDFTGVASFCRGWRLLQMKRRSEPFLSW